MAHIAGITTGHYTHSRDWQTTAGIGIDYRRDWQNYRRDWQNYRRDWQNYRRDWQILSPGLANTIVGIGINGIKS